MVIFGWGWRNKHLRTITMRCPRCGNTVAHPVYKQVLKISLFFVPLIPLKTKYTTQCTSCAFQREVDPAAVS